MGALDSLPFGVIERYRRYLPLEPGTVPVTLGEGSTPLIPAKWLSAELGCRVYLKYEATNPTGSFKDRGMTMAITKAGHLRLDRQHVGFGGGLRFPGRPALRGAHPRG
jgi:threonine synthase